MGELPIWLSTTALGLGTVFIGLASLIGIISLMSRAVALLQKRAPAPVRREPGTEEEEKRLAAAVSAVLAVTGGRILKKYASSPSGGYENKFSGGSCHA